MKMEFV